MTFDEMMLQENITIDEDKKTLRKALLGLTAGAAMAGGLKYANDAPDINLKRSGNEATYRQYNSEKIGNEDKEDLDYKKDLYVKIMKEIKKSGKSSYDFCKELVGKTMKSGSIDCSKFEFTNMSKKNGGYELSYKYALDHNGHVTNVTEKITIPDIPSSKFSY